MIDFSTVKNIVIPEGEVATISRNGEIIWQKQRYKRELLYLESTGTQYIDTQIKLTNNHSIEIDYQFTTIPKTNERKGLYGGLVANVARYGSLVSPTTRCMEYGYGVGNTYYQTSIPDTSRHIIKQEKNKVYFDGVLIYTFKEATFQMPNNALLGTFNYTNYTPALARYYSSRWWNGDTLVRDFIPVLDMNDVPCMYDKVSGNLFYNKGTGVFKYAELPTVPEEYQVVKYIESTGTQYIDTGKFAPLNTDIEVKFQLGDLTNGAVFGGRTAQTAQTCTLFYLATGNPPYFRFDRNSQKIVANNKQVSINTEDNLEFVYKNGVATITNLETNEQNSIVVDTPSSFSGSPICLFAVNTNNTAGTFLKGKIYEWKYWENGDLLQDFIPCYRKSDGKAGMYDLITNTFFANAGTGEFLYG